MLPDGIYPRTSDPVLVTRHDAADASAPGVMSLADTFAYEFSGTGGLED
jgi:hypothetical protein